MFLKTRFLNTPVKRDKKISLFSNYAENNFQFLQGKPIYNNKKNLATFLSIFSVFYIFIFSKKKTQKYEEICIHKYFCLHIFSFMTHSLVSLDITGNSFQLLPLEAIKNIHTLSRLIAQR